MDKAVRPDRRRQGIGQALLDALVLNGNEVGQRVWLAAGYRRQDDWGRWVKNA